MESTDSDAGNAVGDCESGSGVACRVLNERGLALVEQEPIHTAIVGIEGIHRDCRQAGAVLERIIPDGVDAVGDHHAGQAGARSERPAPDAGDAVGDCDAGQMDAVVERMVPDAGDTGGNRDDGQARAVIERPIPDAGDRKAVDRTGDGDSPAEAGVSRDRDPAVIGRVSVLGLHRGGQRQQQQQELGGTGGS